MKQFYKDVAIALIGFIIVALIMVMVAKHFVDIYASCENCTTLLGHYNTYNTTNIVGNVWLG